jgi:Zn-dependent protease
MSSHHIPMGKIFGISIGIDWSWFLIFAGLTWALAVTYYPVTLPGRVAAVYYVLGAITTLILFGSVLLHELGHSVVALHYRMPVRRITLFVFGGVSQIGAESPSPSVEFQVAIAGPIVSFALAILFFFLERTAAPSAPALALLHYLAFINVTLAAFNLIPGFPLDGGRVLRAILWSTTGSVRRATYTAGTVGRVIGFIFIAFGVWLIFTGRLGAGIWIAFIGWFLESAATAQIQQVTIQRILGDHTVAEIMNRQYCTVPPDVSLQEIVDQHILGGGGGRRCLVIARDDRVAGLVTLHQIREVPRERWPEVTVAEIMTPEAKVKRVGPNTRVWSAMAAMDRDGVNQLPVMEDGQILGMLSRDDVIGFLRTIHELEP